MPTVNENKGYKFRLEYTETDFYEDDKDEHNKYDMKYVAYGEQYSVHKLPLRFGADVIIKIVDALTVKTRDGI